MNYELNGKFAECYSVTIIFDDVNGKVHRERTVWFHNYNNAHSYYRKRDSQLRNDPNVKTVYGGGIQSHALPDQFAD